MNGIQKEDEFDLRAQFDMRMDKSDEFKEQHKTRVLDGLIKLLHDERPDTMVFFTRAPNERVHIIALGTGSDIMEILLDGNAELMARVMRPSPDEVPIEKGENK